MAQLAIIVGIDKIKQDEKKSIEAYRVVIATVNNKSESQLDWKFDCQVMSKNTITESILKGAKWLNVKLEDGELKGSTGSLTRFEDTEHRPIVIISQINSSEGKVLGYKVVSYDGVVKNIPLKELLAYGNRVKKINKVQVPVQNAIFVPADENKKEHFKAYPNCKFITEEIQVQNNKYAENKRLNTSKNEKTLSKLNEIYTKDQLIELKLGKEHGIDIKIIANPALKAEQMKVLRGGLEQGLNIRVLAFPEFTVDQMRYYISDLKQGLDIKKYLSPKYDVGQISELSLAIELGLDITKMNNPKLSATDMQEIRERLQRNIWKTELVKKYGSWS